VILLNRDGSTDNSVCSLGKNDVGVTFLHVKNVPTLAIVIILYHCIRYKAKFYSLVCVYVQGIIYCSSLLLNISGETERRREY